MTSTTLAEGESQPRVSDRGGIVAICCFVLGLGILLPWNAFITVQNYWNYKFRNPMDASEVTSLHRTFNSYCSIAFNLPYILSMGLATYYSHKIRHVLANSVCLCLVLATFISVTCMVPVNTDGWQNLFLAITLCQIVSISINNGVVQTGVTGLISRLPPKFIGNALEGQALAGVLTSLLNVGILVWRINPIRSALIYFVCSMIGILCAVLCYALLHSTAFFKSYYSKSADCKQEGIELSPGKGDDQTLSMLSLIQHTWKYCLSMTLVLWVTLAVFPSVTAQVQSIYAGSNSALATTLYSPVFCFVLFNVADYIGRLLAKWAPFPQSRPNLLVALNAARAIFIPLFMLCNLRIHHYLPTLFAHDAFFIIFMTIFALSNGYSISTIFVQGPKSLEDPKNQQKAGSLLVTCLGLGINLGAVSSLLCVYLL